MKNTCATCDDSTPDEDFKDLVECSYYGRTDGRKYKMTSGWCRHHSAERNTVSVIAVNLFWMAWGVG